MANMTMRLKVLLRSVKAFRDDILTEFDVDKCAKGHFPERETEDLPFSCVLRVMKELKQEQTYKYQ